MKILVLIYHGINEHGGINKKIHYQIKGFCELDHVVHICTYLIDQIGNQLRKIDDIILQNYDRGKSASIKKELSYRFIMDYCKKEYIDFVYAHFFHNANPFTIHLFNRLHSNGINLVIEIPTYPYDSEYLGTQFDMKIKLFIDKIFFYKLAKQTDYIVIFSNDIDIFRQKTINISNGIDLDIIPLRKTLTTSSIEINLIDAPGIHYWHIFDKLIHGLGKYCKNGGKQKKIFSYYY